MKRISVLFLAVLMMLSLFSACGEEEKTPSTTETDEIVTDDGTYEADDLDAKYHLNRAISVFTWSEKRNEDWQDDRLSAIAIDQAVYDSRAFVEERMGITFDITEASGNWDARNDYVTAVDNLCKADASDVPDIVGHYTPTAALCALKGLYADINELTYPDFDKPWWPGNINQSCAIGDRLYFCTGDITQTCITEIGTVFVNLDRMEDYGITENVYDLVYDYKWTLEKMENMFLGKVAIAEETSDQTEFGIIVSRGVYDNLFFSGGFTFVDRDEDGTLSLSENILSEQMDDWFRDCKNLLYYNSDVFSTTQYSGVNVETFAGGHALVYMSQTLTDARAYIQNASFDYAVLPYPMSDESQKAYYSITGYSVTMFSIPEFCTSTEESALVLEALGSSAYRVITPAVYEVTFQYQFMRSEANANMLNLIHDSIIYDTGRIFADDVSMFNLFRQAHEGTNWITYRDGNKEAWKNNINSIWNKLGQS